MEEHDNLERASTSFIVLIALATPDTKRIMDLFDDSDEDNDESDCADASALCNLAFISLMICKPFVKRTSGEISQLLHRKIAIIGNGSASSSLKGKLDKTQFKDVAVFSSNLEAQIERLQYDVVVNFRNDEQSTFPELLVYGGTYLTICTASQFDQLFPIEIWNLAKTTRKTIFTPDNGESGTEFVVIQKRALKINTLGAIYWTGDGSSSSAKIGEKKSRNRISSIDGGCKSISLSAIHREYCNLEEATVALSISERQLGIFSDASHAKAVHSLQTFGICILPGLFSSDMVMKWGAAAVSDMTEALMTLRKKGIDLLNPGDGGPRIENFHELSMREALRCDLRNGRHLRKLSSCNTISTARESPVGAIDKSCLATNLPIDTAIQSHHIAPDENIRYHPALLSVLDEVLNPLPTDPRDQLGNWGLWNFEGKGPEAGPPDFVVGEVGVVMSLPGCADQTIHADTAHLYVHTQLPGHYINLFVPAVSAGSSSAAIEVGQTAFVLGSHQLRVSAHVMNEEGGQQILEERLVRPHLMAGDALLFDCRILHFGLANQHPKNGGHDDDSVTEKNEEFTKGWRPLLYVNYHQKFFQDPKNWNDKERLFE